jgi:hypothetical protein
MIDALLTFARAVLVMAYLFVIAFFVMSLGGCAHWKCPPDNIECNLKMEAMRNERFTTWVQNNPSQTFHSTYMGYSGYYWH